MSSTFSAFFDSWLRATQIDVTRYVAFSIGVWFVLWVRAQPRRSAARRDTGVIGQARTRQLLVEFFTLDRARSCIFSTVGLLTFGLFRARAGCRGP